MSGGGRRIEIRGVVQGVGLRPWVYRLATSQGLVGMVRNGVSGVTIEAFGSEASLQAFEHDLASTAPPAAVIREMLSSDIDATAAEAFVIASSGEDGERRLSIPPDLGTCEECCREMADPADRRYGYPFTNCTSCGPRYTIALGVPYDRPATTMQGFELCPSCRREYLEPSDRRFHAQPNACPECGPQLRLVTPLAEERTVSEEATGAEALEWLVTALREGRIAAVKGLGGFHLACDATAPAVVEELRRRKGRDAKPFAVMVRDLAGARELAHLRPEEEDLLASVERPIVLVEGREPNPLAPQVAPSLVRGKRLLGLMLPYTPLHHLLLDQMGRPLIMTSGNLAEEPMEITDAGAVGRLGRVADVILLHDREIAGRCDDSVARCVAGAPMVMRRSRGYVPRPIPVRRPFARPVLACGAHLKNTFCLGVGDVAYLGPHVGDLESLETYDAFTEAVERLEGLLQVSPEVVVHDLHPEYLSSRYAQERPGVERIAVQHHHAHAVSAMAEHGLEGPVLAVCFDGTGLGPDGTAWGGEILWAREDGYRRLATLRPLVLAGGDRAVREVWRQALALLDDAFEGEAPLDAFEVFERVAPQAQRVVRQMIATDLNATAAHGVGRLFDAVGALLLGVPVAAYEGQVAAGLNLLADPAERGLYPLPPRRRARELEGAGGPSWELDTRPLVRALVEDVVAGEPRPLVAARFHNALAAATAAGLRQCLEELGDWEALSTVVPGGQAPPVVLSGGCFQNPLLAERLSEALAPQFAVYRHRQVPPGDGGLALGQAVIGDRRAPRAG